MIEEIELYDDGFLKLIEYRVMLGDECVAKSWREVHGEPQPGDITGSGVVQDGDLSHYTLPTWYTRQQKLDQLL